jgi:hypothetical protein
VKGLYRKAGWYRHRLASMSTPEIVHRVREGLRRRADRGAASRLRRTVYADAALPSLPGLAEALAAWTVPPELAGEWEGDLHRAVAGRFFLLGRQWPACDRDARWHLDPVTGRTWPQAAYCFDIDYRHAPDMGDVKYVWELGRLQYLQPIAALAFVRQSHVAAAFCVAELESWIDNNPPHRGVHWASGIELALRVVSILVVTSLLGEQLAAAQRGKIHASLEAHAHWLERYPSLYSSANNHRAAEGLGLFVVGALCPHLSRARRWRTQGWDMLCETARLQILSDGVGAEQAIAYTAIVLEMLLLGLHVARATGQPVPDEYLGRIVAGGEWLRWLTDEGGSQPRIGDDDNARILGAYARDETYIRSIQGCIAAVANRADLTPPCLAPHFRQCLFGAAPAPAPAPAGLRTFAEGGYTVGRHTVAGHAIMLAIDHGYLGYLSIAAHGHADALALWLHIDDQPVLVDAGTYLYHAGGAWRQRFRGTAAHNTLCLDDADSSTMSGSFNWSHKAGAALKAITHTEDTWSLEAEHDGYRNSYDAIHRRRLTVCPDRGVTVEDRLSAAAPHRVTVTFLLHPALTAVMDGDAIRIARDGAALLRLRHTGPLSTAIGHPGTDPGGWYSPTFGVKLATTRIAFTGTLAPDQVASTAFALA